MKPQERILVALDVPSADELKKMVDVLGPEGAGFKVGLEVLSAIGPSVVTEIKRAGAKIFYDGKFNDIPNTVAGASKAVATLGVDFFDVHASCGLEGMRAAVANRIRSKVLAVTVLTSFDEASSKEVFGQSPAEKVVSFAKLALKAGVDGVVCSGKELELLSGKEFSSLEKVVPGIRPEWADTGDQKRVLTPSQALKRGATYLVIGRPILQPPSSIGSPKEAFRRICSELGEVK